MEPWSGGWIKVSPPKRGGHKGIQPHHEGTMDFSSETTHSRAIPRNCPMLSSSSKNKPRRTPPATSQWRKIKKRENFLKLHQTLFVFNPYQLLTQATFCRWLVTSGVFFFLSTIWSHCKVSKDAEYCIIYKDLKQGVFSVSICLLGSLGLFVCLFFFLFVNGGKKKKPLQFFLFITIFTWLLYVQNNGKKKKTKRKRRETHIQRQICLSYSRDNHP